MLRRFCILTLFLLMTAAVRAQPAGLVITWIDGGDLHVWHDGAVQSVVLDNGVQPYLAPDGTHVAVTRGRNNLPDALAVVDANSAAVRELVPAGSIPAAADSETLIGDVRWFDAATLYFTTFALRMIGESGLDARADLYRIDVNKGTMQEIVAAGAGGSFVFSPNRQFIALASAGEYGGLDGRISIINPLGQQRRDLFTFPAVSTASEYRFYPPLFWEADGTALRVAIPAPGLIYGDGMTQLWRLPLDGTPQLLGSVMADFFGQPRWSADGAALAYLRREGALEDNQVALVLADGSGANERVISAGQVGTLNTLQWLVDANRFVYIDGDSYALVTPDGTTQSLGTLFNPLFVHDGVIYASQSSKSFDLLYAPLEGGEVATIGHVENNYPAFSAVIPP